MAQIIVNTVIYLHCDILPPFISYVNEGYVKKSEDKIRTACAFAPAVPIYIPLSPLHLALLLLTGFS